MSHDHDESHQHHHGGPRPSFGAVFNNFRTYDAPLHEKLRLALRNTWFKIRTGSSCCGNDGEPGC